MFKLIGIDCGIHNHLAIKCVLKKFLTITETLILSLIYYTHVRNCQLIYVITDLNVKYEKVSFPLFKPCTYNVNDLYKYFV